MTLCLIVTNHPQIHNVYRAEKSLITKFALTEILQSLIEFCQRYFN